MSSLNCQLPPLEHIVWPKRSRQASLRELLTGKVGALKGEPPESAGRDTPKLFDKRGYLDTWKDRLP